MEICKPAGDIVGLDADPSVSQRVQVEMTVRTSSNRRSWLGFSCRTYSIMLPFTCHSVTAPA